MLQKEFKELLPKTIQDAMAALAETSNATDEITIPVLLSVASFATQGLANGFPGIDNWTSCAINNYFCVLVPSGGLKTSISDSVLVGARRFESDNRPQAAEADVDYQIALGKYKNEIKNKSKVSSSPVSVPGIVPPVNKIVKPALPRASRYISSKFTLNGLIKALTGVPHFGIFNSDAAEFFNSHAFKDPTSSIELVSAMSKLWSGEQIDKLTGIEDTITAGKRTTALFMLQQQLADFFVNSQYKDQGFTNRILITQSGLVAKKRADFSRLTAESVVRGQDPRLIAFNDRVYALLSQVDKNQISPPQKNITNSEDRFAVGMAELRIRLSGLVTPAADQDVNILNLDTHLWNYNDSTAVIFQDFYNDMIERAEQESEYQNFINRAYEHCIRIATVLSLFNGDQVINEKTAMCAAGLMYYFIDQRENLDIDGGVRANPTVECGEHVHKFIIKYKNDNPGKEITKKVLNNSGPYSYRKMDADSRDKVIQELLSRDQIVIETVGKKTVIHGKQSEVR